MKKKSLFIFMGVLLTAFTLTNCKKVTTSNTPTSNNAPIMGLSIQAVNPSFNLPVTSSVLKAAAATSLVKITAASLKVSKLSFDAELKKSNTDKDSISIDYDWNGPKVIDLLNPTNEFGQLTLQPGFYDEIEIKVLSVGSKMDTVPVFNLIGTYTDSANNVIPIQFTVNSTILLETEMKNDTISTSVGGVFSGIVKIYLDQLFVNIKPVDLNNAVKTNGTIMINSTTNRNLYMIIAANFLMRHHGEFHSHHH